MKMLTIFWLSIISIFYTYLGYPLILFIVSLFRQTKVKRDTNYLPSVTLIITVHNEESRIKEKIKNTLELDYPRDRLQIIFASDASTDSTDDIVTSYADRGINLVRQPMRKGKESAQKYAIEQASGDIIVFTDVATMLEKDSIKNIVSNFADPSVGCVSSEDRFIDEHGNLSGEGFYVKYEMWLRSLESKVNSVVGLSGSFFAARKEICTDWPIDIPSDFNTLLNSIKLGFRGISDPLSIGIYKNIKNEKKEFMRKVRTITRGISALMANMGLLNPMHYGIFSWQLISHKLMRWKVPFFMLTALFTSIYLALRSGFFRLVLLAELAFYALAGLGYRATSIHPIFKIPYYFVQANLAASYAWIKYFKGERFTTWTPSNR